MSGAAKGKGAKNASVIRVLMIGDSAVGKTSLVIRFDEDSFSTKFITTIGVDYRDKLVTIEDAPIKLQIWDTAGQERFRTITVSYFKGAHGIVLVYDITDRDTFESIRQWVEQIHEYADVHVNILLVGNKCDQEEQRAVATAEGDALAREYGIDFFETSARENVNVEECYLAIARKTKARLLESEEAAVELRETITVAPEQSEKDRRKKKCAC